MKNLIVLACAIVVSISTPSSAQWFHDGAPVPDSHWSKYKDGFGAALFLTVGYEAVVEGWNSAPNPDLPTIEKAVRGTPVSAMVVFIGCADGEAGTCAVRADYRLRLPEGAVVAEMADVEIWDQKGQPSALAVELGVECMSLTIPPHAPLGKLRFEATVRDRNAEVVLELFQELEIIAGGD